MGQQTAAPSAATPTIVELPERQTAIVRVNGSAADLPRLMGEAFDLTARAIARSGAQIAAEPFARYFGFGEPISAEVGFPFVGTLEPTAPVEVSSLPGGRAVTMTHVGPYDELGGAWQRGQSWLSGRGLTLTGAPWECYLTGPDVPGMPVTQIYWPIR
jgi:effector-binding domain-containing protein